LSYQKYIHTYNSRFIPEGVVEGYLSEEYLRYQIFLRDTHVLPKLVSYEEHANVTGGKPIVVLLQSISDVSANNPLVAFYGIHRRKR
jgi:hypothetical protein